MKIVKKLSEKLLKFYTRHPLLTNVIGGIIVLIINVIFFDKLQSWFIENFLKSDFFKVIFFSIMFSLFSILSISYFYLYLAMDNKSIREKLHEFESELNIFDGIGLAYILNNEVEANIEENLKLIRDELITENEGSLDMLLTTGYEIISMDMKHESKDFIERYKVNDFDRRIAIFHEVLPKIKRKVRILLLNPYCQVAKGRGKDTIGNPKHYSNLILRME